LERDASLAPALREQVLEMKSRRRHWDAILKDELRTQPMLAFSIDSVAAIHDELELLLADPDPELRQLGCAVLRRDFGIRPAACNSP
jgi:hypothetical protein